MTKITQLGQLKQVIAGIRSYIQDILAVTRQVLLDDC
jgi:hypothetical protein